MERKLTFKEKLLIITKRQKKKANKHALIATGMVMVFMALLVIFKNSQSPQVTRDNETIFSASIVGDMMFGGYVEEVAQQHGYSYLLENVSPYLVASDYVTGNFENPVTKKGDYKSLDKEVVLQTSPDAVKALKKANFTTVNVANNHVMDYKVNGLRDTYSSFNKEKLGLVGAVKDALPNDKEKLPTDVLVNYYGQQVNLSKLAVTTFYMEKSGLTIATLGFTDQFTKETKATTNRPGILPANLEIMLPLIKEAKSRADLVFVHMHWGEEYDMEPSPRMKELAKVVSEAGADVIIGHHSHVLSSVDVYKNTIILYGMGNFICDQGWSRTKDSVIAQYQLNKNGQVKVELIPLRIQEARPEILGTLGWFTRGKIFRELTKYTTNKENWVVENNKLVYRFTNPTLLKEVSLNGK